MRNQLGVGVLLTSYLHLEVFSVELISVAPRINCSKEYLL